VVMGMLPGVTGSQKSNMAATEPEVLISRLLDEMATNSDGFNHVFMV
jgi:hypothetical protein